MITEKESKMRRGTKHSSKRLYSLIIQENWTEYIRRNLKVEEAEMEIYNLRIEGKNFNEILAITGIEKKKLKKVECSLENKIRIIVTEIQKILNLPDTAILKQLAQLEFSKDLTVDQKGKMTTMYKAIFH